MPTLTATLLLVTLTLSAQAPSSQPTSRVTGRVVDAATGEPVVDARIMLFRSPESVRAPAARGVPPTASGAPVPAGPYYAQTNSSGVFEFGAVPSGRWRVQAQKDGYVTFGLNPPLSILDVAGTGVGAFEIRLDRGGVITGRVLDARGNPLSRVTVQAQPVTRSPNGAVRPMAPASYSDTNDLGEFRLAGLPPGQHYVSAQPRPLSPVSAGPPPEAAVTYVPTFYPGFAEMASASPVNVVQGATTNGIDFALMAVPAHRVSGVVVDSDGRAVAGALVRLQAKASSSLALLQSAPSAADGTFRVVNVPAGTYWAVAAIPVVIRNGNSTMTSTDFRTAGGLLAAPEVVVQAGDVAGVRVVVGQR